MAHDANPFRVARERAGLSVLDLAHLFHVQPAQVYMIESGKRGAGVLMRRRYVEHGLMTPDEALEAA